MIWRIRTRREFARLSAEGRRLRAGVLWCTYRLDPTSSPPRVAFAIGRAFGVAAARNHVRRRLRAILRDASSAGRLPAGEYLIGALPAAATRSFVELQFDVEQLLRRLPS